MLRGVSLFFLLLFSAQGGILVEPFGGFSFSPKAKDKYLDYDVSYGNWNLGSRLGIVFSVFMLGLEGDYKAMTVNYEGPGGKLTPKIEQTNLGLFVGVWLPLALNLRASYFFSSHWNFIDYEQTFGLDAKYTGNGFGLGAGWRFLKVLALNFDFRYFEYDKFKENTIGEKFKVSDILISLSLPLNLGG